MKRSPIISAVIALSLSFTALANSANQRPNVLLIYTDDHRYSGVHSLAGTQVQTPSIDQLKEEGIAFHNAYLMGAFSGATCIPSRASLLTGRNLFQLEQPGRNLPADHTTIGQAFQASGYKTHIVGKWHQDKVSLARSFESGSTVMGLSAYLVDHYRMPLWDWDSSGNFPKEDAYLLEYADNGEIIRRPLSKDDKRGPTGVETLGPHTSEIFAENASQYIEAQNGEKPFFMYLAFHAPHDPRQAPKAYKDLYPENEIELPPSYLSEHPFDNGHIYLRDEKLAPWPRTPVVSRKELSDYYAIITHLDAQIGRVINTLKTSGQYENTLIVLCGDSGLAVGNHGLMGKQNVYDEDGIHVPLIFAGGALDKQLSDTDAFCYIHDIYPTLCEIAGVELPESVTGESLLPVITGKSENHHDHTYHAYMQYQRAYRKGEYKLIEYVRSPGHDWEFGDVVRGSRVTQLFNYVNDPWETHNLAYFPENELLLQQMRNEMRKAAKFHGDSKQELINYNYDFWDHYE